MTKTNLNTLCASLDSLAARWSDEKAYEDFTDFEAAALKATEVAGAEFVSLEQKPFRLTINENGVHTELTVKGKQIDVRTESPALSSARKIAAAPKAAKPAAKAAPKAAKPAAKAAVKAAVKAVKDTLETYVAKITDPKQKAAILAAAKAAKAKAATKPAVDAKPKAVGIGARTVELLKSGLGPKAAFEALQKEMGEVSSLASVYWYSSKIRCG